MKHSINGWAARLTALGVVVAGNVMAGEGAGAPSAQYSATAVINTGPISAFGESADEAAKKRVVFEWTHMMMRGQVQAAFEKYVSKSFADHSHLVRAQCKCAHPGYQEAITSFLTPHKEGPPASAAGQPAGAGLPTLATVDDDMVTMYNPGVDVFRVVDGKITDHWDASPAAAISLPAEKPFPKDL